MSSPSDSPPDSVVEKPQNPVSQVTQATVDDNQNAKAEAAKESSPPSVFVNSEPIREDQVQNAVKFLSHPKVRGSPVIYRRSFLERKGLTKEEIDEAFRRVPDPTPSVTASESVVTNQGDGQLKSSSNIQSQSPAQTLQPGPVAPAGSISKMEMFSRFHWSHALLAVGFLAVSGAGTAVLLKNSIIPRLKAWVRKVALEEEEKEELLEKNNTKTSLAEEAAAAARAAATAASDVARTSQEMMMSKTEEKRCFEELINMLNAQVREMKSMSNAIQKLEGQSNIHRIPVEERDDHRISQRSSRVPYGYANGKMNDDPQSVRSLSPPTYVEPSIAQHPKSYTEIMAMTQRGEKPSNIREIYDTPPNPNQPVTNPRLAPWAKPWEVSQAQNSSSNVLHSQGSGAGDALYHEFQYNQSIADNTVPWQERRNARITGIEAGDDGRFGSSNVVSNERPVTRSWVPPQPPPVAMQEAAAAIRQPKKTLSSKEQLTDDQLLARSSDVQDELQRITRISESGGAVDANGGGPGLNSSEIQREDDSSYFET